MEALSLNKTLMNAKNYFNGVLNENTVTFNNSFGKGVIEGVSLSEQMIVTRINLTLKEDVSIIRDQSNDDKHFTFLLGNPIDVKFLDEKEKNTVEFESLGAFCARTPKTIKWTFKGGETTQIIMIRVRRDYLDQFINQSKKLKEQFAIGKEIILFEPLKVRTKEVYNQMFSINLSDLFSDKLLETYSNFFMSMFFKRVLKKEELVNQNQSEINLVPVYKAKDILEQELNKPISIDELTKKVGLSESRLRVLFKKVIGSTIHQYHQDVRLSRSQDMLLKGDKTLSMIASDIGYSSGSHFSMVFKKHFNISPTEFRNRKLNFS